MEPLRFGLRFFVILICTFIWQGCRQKQPSQPQPNQSSFPVQIFDETGMDDPVYGTVQGSNENPAVSFGGTHSLIVWQDERQFYFDSIYGTRIGLDGAVLDPVGFPIAVEFPFSQGAPAAAFNTNSGNHLVVWMHLPPGAGQTTDLHGALINTEGAIQYEAGFEINSSAQSQIQPAMVAYADGWFVVWTDTRTQITENIYGTIVDSDGTVLDPSGIPIATDEKSQQKPAVAFGNDLFFVVWRTDQTETDTALYGARIDTNGIVLDPDYLEIETIHHVDSPGTAFDGENFTTVWRDADGEPIPIYSTRINTDGVVLDSPAIQIISSDDHEWAPVIAFDGTNSMVASVYRGGTNGVHTARLATDGTLLDLTPTTLDSGTRRYWNTALACGNGDCVVAWEKDGDDPEILPPWASNPDIYAKRINSDGTPQGTSFAVNINSNAQDSQDLAFDGEVYLVAWTDYRNDSTDIFGVTLGKDGDVLNQTGLPICTADEGQAFVSVGSNGNGFFVAWSDERNEGQSSIYGTRVTSEGIVQDPDGIAIATGGVRDAFPFVTSNGTDYLVLWENTPTSGEWSEVDIRAARVDASNGTVLDSPSIPISTATGRQSEVAAHFDGTNYLTLWTDNRLLIEGEDDIYGAIIAQNGTVVAPGEIMVSNASNTQGRPSLAFDGTNYLAVWEDKRSGQEQVYASRIGQGGEVLDPNGFLAMNASQANWARVSYLETRFLVSAESDTGVVVSRIMANGSITDALPIVVNDDPGLDPKPEMASAHDGYFVVVYWGFKEDQIHSSHRVSGNRLEWKLIGQECSTNADCFSDSCVDNVCCDSECEGAEEHRCTACSVAAGSSIDGQCKILAAGVTCRETLGICDIEETCDGASSECPPDQTEQDGDACDDESPCTLIDLCQDGECIGTDPKDCTSPSECEEGSCEAISGNCVFTPLPDGTSCQGGECVDGVCIVFSDASTIDGGPDSSTIDGSIDSGVLDGQNETDTNATDAPGTDGTKDVDDPLTADKGINDGSDYKDTSSTKDFLHSEGNGNDLGNGDTGSCDCKIGSNPIGSFSIFFLLMFLFKLRRLRI